MDAQDHRSRHAAGSPVCSQLSPGAVETQRGTALEGRRFYVWDEDRQTAVAWANELAAAASASDRGDRAGGTKPGDGKPASGSGSSTAGVR